MLENEAINNTLIVSNNLSSFDTSSINNNVLYVDTSGVYNSEAITLGSNFGSKPTLSVSSADYLSDLSSSIIVSISAAEFSSLLASNTDTSTNTVSVTDPSNLSVLTDTSSSSGAQTSLSPTVQGWSHVQPSSFQTNYDGTNRIGNLTTLDSSRTTPGTYLQNAHWIGKDGTADELTVLQALRIPLMGIAPHLTMSDEIILADTAENLSLGLKTFTEGQLASFNKIKITDDSVLVTDAATFKLIDTATQSVNWSTMNGLSVVNSNGNNATIKVTGSYSDFIDSGLYSSSTGFASEIENNAGANLINQISEYSLTGTATSSTDVTNASSFINSAPSGVSISSAINVSTALINLTASGNLTAAEFTDIAQQAALIPNFLADNYPSGFNLVDTADNLKAILTSTSSTIIAAKDYIAV